MKKLILFLLCLTALIVYGQEASTVFEGHNWKAPYTLPVPKDWTTERFRIPIGFAPGISYKGVEDIRFSPGWGKKASDEYWTYAFLWWLDGKEKIDEKIITENLKAYYTGLIIVNTDSTSKANEKINPVTTSFKKTTRFKNDLETFSGTIVMTDYMQRKPITLNCIVHVILCSESNFTAVFYELSPMPFTHNNWNILEQLWVGFACKR